MQLQSLTIDRQTQPLSIDVPSPSFAWVVANAPRGTTPGGYRIEVARSMAALAADRPDLWDSGLVAGDASFDVAYNGPPLTPSSRYYWKVVAHTSAGNASATSWFETAPSPQQWSRAQWIGKPPGGSLAAPLLRRVLTVKNGLESARLYVAAGGYANVSINGKPASDAVLSPDFTNYNKRALYLAHDVTALLKPGSANAIGIELGRGYYGLTNPNVWHWEKAPWHGEPRVRVLLKLCYVDGRCEFEGTDAHWRIHDGPTVLDDVYGGETYDARLELPGFDTVAFDDRNWRAAAVLPAPEGVLQAQREPPVRVAATLQATTITRLPSGSYVFAFPRVIAGWATLAMQGKAGDTIVLHYGEKLLPDGSVDDRDDHHYFGHGLQTDRITLAGRGVEHWHSRFSWKGFRYVQVDGWPGSAPSLSAMTAQVVHSDVAVIGHFSSSHPLLNWIHTAAVDTVLNNLYGIPTDTPMYEKNGWTGDGMLGADMMLRNVDADTLLSKWVRDIADARNAEGAPLLIAPNPGWGDVRAPPWHAAYVLVPWSLYWQRGDRHVLAEHVDGMARYVDLEFARSSGGIADTELGDWVSPSTPADGGNAPEDKRIAATAYLYRMAETMAQIERVLGNDDTSRHFDAMSAQVRSAFNQQFFDPAQGLYRGQGDEGVRQTHQLLALDFGLVPEAQRRRVVDALVQAVHAHDNHLDTGALGSKLLLPTLTAMGHADLAWIVATQTSFPSWGYWRENGATSLWEHWKLDARSRGHYFLGSIDDWLFGDVAGLKPLAPGWQRIGIYPALVPWLDHAEADTMTPFGRTAVAWSRSRGKLQLDLEVPVGSTAEVHLPRVAPEGVTESGQSLSTLKWVHGLHACGTDTCFELESGQFRFSAWTVRSAAAGRD
ncbi:alpha-L-rhamnosidase [Dyella sp. GSA-30]|uniref:alpha-L-rhamnosidase n=1 Tax=Dyella sp. GSA-30 TaxID=2994496 RepID=UPI002493B0B6|nr:alpha-L-rhamnosidase [Dyella sp. GSA-30]